MSSDVFSYRNSPIEFTTAGWINATKLAAYYGKQINNYFVNMETTTYIRMLCESKGVDDPRYFVQTRRGRNGGTWLQIELAIHFAHWLIKRRESAYSHRVTLLPLKHHSNFLEDQFTGAKVEKTALTSTELDMIDRLEELSWILNQRV